MKRGIDSERIGPLGLGYSPKGADFLDAMETLGVGQDVLLEVGLAVKRDDDTVRPRFWNRLLFPIRDLRGRTVGFGGRVLGAGEPKYLNSPESPVFHKGRLLYNLHDAKHVIRLAERAVVVEGYFDVLRLADEGVEEVVAPLGTSLTAEQAQLLARYTKSVILLYDHDPAGLRATFRASDELLRASLRVTVATLPPGEDPDSLAAKGGGGAVRELLDDSIDVLERKLQLLELKGWLGTISGRRRALDRLVPTIRAAADSVTRDLYVNRTAEALGVSRESVEREARGRWGLGPRAAPPARGGGSPRRETRHTRASPERELLRVMLHAPEWRTRISELLPEAAELHEPEGELLKLVAATGPDTAGSDLVSVVEGETRVLLLELVERGLGEQNIDAIVEGALRRLENRSLAKQKRAVTRRMTMVPETEKEKVELLREQMALSRESLKLNTPDWNAIRRGGESGAG